MEGRRLWSVGGGHPGLSRNGTQKWQFKWPKWSSITTLWGFTHLLLNFWTSFLCKDHGWPTPKTPGNGNGLFCQRIFPFCLFLSHQKGWNFPWISHCLQQTKIPHGSPMDFPKADMDGSNFRRLCKDPRTVGCWAQLYQDPCFFPTVTDLDPIRSIDESTVIQPANFWSFTKTKIFEQHSFNWQQSRDSWGYPIHFRTATWRFRVKYSIIQL